MNYQNAEGFRNFQIVRGAPTDEEIAALAIALAEVASTGREKTVARPARHWGAVQHRRVPPSGANGWRKSIR